MSSNSYVLITCDVGKNLDVKKELENMDQVKEVEATFGAYDLVAKVETGSNKHYKEKYGNKIRKIKSVRSILTLLVTKENHVMMDSIPK